MVKLMFAVVSKVHPSVRWAYLDSLDELMTSLSAVYAKLQGIEPEVCRGVTVHGDRDCSWFPQQRSITWRNHERSQIGPVPAMSRTGRIGPHVDRTRGSP